MPAYIIVDVEITDPVEYEEYKKHTPGSLVPFDGKFLARGSTVETLEGDWKPGRLVILEFPTLEKAKAWWNSPEYTPAKLIRQRASNTKMIVADGIS
ncbi:MAG TPA: DUF1330 domain-containing protein [Cyclobacteriaceae bacterium]